MSEILLNPETKMVKPIINLMLQKVDFDTACMFLASSKIEFDVYYNNIKNKYFVRWSDDKTLNPKGAIYTIFEIHGDTVETLLKEYEQPTLIDFNYIQEELEK